MTDLTLKSLTNGTEMDLIAVGMIFAQPSPILESCTRYISNWDLVADGTPIPRVYLMPKGEQDGAGRKPWRGVNSSPTRIGESLRNKR